jgi:hypothetical protein
LAFGLAALPSYDWPNKTGVRQYAMPLARRGQWIHFVPQPIIPVPPVPLPQPVDLSGGVPHLAKRYPIDDEEITEFLRLWVTWNDVE